jgi:apolipoprotein N-acyltransferase
MNGEKKFLLVAFCLGLFCLTVLVSWLFVAFWRWKELLALGLIILLVFVVLGSMTVMILGALNEQALRRQRVLYKSELPLDAAGRPLYLPKNMQQVHPYQPLSVYPAQQGDCYYE